MLVTYFRLPVTLTLVSAASGATRQMHSVGADDPDDQMDSRMREIGAPRVAVTSPDGTAARAVQAHTPADIAHAATDHTVLRAYHDMSNQRDNHLECSPPEADSPLTMETEEDILKHRKQCSLLEYCFLSRAWECQRRAAPSRAESRQ